MASQRDPHRCIRQCSRHAAMHHAGDIPVIVAHGAFQRDAIGMPAQHTNPYQFVERHVLRRAS